MGKSIFISYKYGDNTVYGQGTTVRDYVDALQTLLDKEDHVNKGEADDTDLSHLADETIRKKLADRMFYSTITIVLISPNMKESYKYERYQWIPWEISYSLRTEHREHGNSNPNAMIAVVLPDASGSYGYYITEDNCPHCHTRTLATGTLFPILKKNMFNTPNKTSICRTVVIINLGPFLGGHLLTLAQSSGMTLEPMSTIILRRSLERQSNRNDYQINAQLEQ